MIKPAIKLKLILWLALGLLVLIVWQLRLQASPIKGTSWNYLFNVGVAVFYFVAAGLAFGRRRLLPVSNRGRSVLSYFGLAALFWGLAFVVWTYYNVILEQSVPYPSLADPLFLASYPLLGLAVLRIRENYRVKSGPTFTRESILFIALTTLAIFAFLNRPDLSPDLGLAKNLLNVAYSLGDVLLVTMAYVGIRGSRVKERLGLYTIVLFLVLQAAADFLFAYRNNAGVYWNGDVADLLFGASGWLLALALAQDDLLIPFQKGNGTLKR